MTKFIDPFFKNNGMFQIVLVLQIWIIHSKAVNNGPQFYSPTSNRGKYVQRNEGMNIYIKLPLSGGGYLKVIRLFDFNLKILKQTKKIYVSSYKIRFSV